MWVYLEIEPEGLGLGTKLVTGDKKVGRYPVLYDDTCRGISKKFPKAEGLVIPELLGGGYKYDVSLLMLQLRLETTSGLQRLPIKIRFDNDERFLTFCDRLGMTEARFAGIGIVLIPPDTRAESIPPHPPQPDAVQRYLDQFASRPWFTQGRHNQANRWGPYIFFRVLEQLDSTYATTRESIEQRMFEEPYLKHLAGDMRDEGIPNQLLVTLRSERDKFRNRLLGQNRGQKILVVEDRLDEGWREVYETFFDSADSRISVDWATTVDEAHAKFDKDVDLVVLDVRLDPKDEATASSDDLVPTGVTLAKWFRKKWSPIPIMAATASNKTWILEPLLKEGIKGYWVKESPEHSSNLAHAVRNVIDLYRKARDILEWSDKTRPWIEGLRNIGEQVCDTDLRRKADSLHALLDRAFSPFSQDLDKGLQRNIAFLILFSCHNDLRDWCCRRQDKDDDGEDWIFVEELGGGDLVSYDQGKNKYEMEYKGRQWSYDNFPDTNVFYEILMRLGCTAEGLSFDELRKKRNAIPLTHGSAEAGSGSAETVGAVTDDDISKMLAVLQAVVEKRVEKRRSAQSGAE